MPQFWWVNHNKTGRQEIDGQYLWSPKTERSSREGERVRSEFYNNMRRASPGDIVLSYFEQAVRYVGRVTDFAFTAPQPPEFGNRGANWSDVGWLLPVFWTPLDPPIRLKTVYDTIKPLLPMKYSPLTRVGGGSQKAYFSAIPPEVFDIVVASAAYSRQALAQGGANSLTFQVVTELLDDAVERSIAEDFQLEDTVRTSVIQARRGQGKFRKNVEARERACRLTGITNPTLLIASHIKPWRLCDTAQERLDGMNGLLLTPDADLLFDRGFVSFEDDGEVMVSPRVDREDLRRLGFDQLAMERFGVAEAPAIWRTEGFGSRQCDYLDYHRKQVFVA